MAYRAAFTGLGEEYGEFFEQGMVVVFNENAPAELAELAALHTISVLEREVKPGDEIVLGNKRYTVTAVGEKANDTLGKLGHCTFIFTGAAEAELDGQIVLKGDGMPDLKAGDPFEINFR
ncbi:hypothetical protein AGMMS49942_07940 [Spirochaetia bacterium]|nr:hypothetical protein AGMMS49942_07940 [Spirochaetia bacterium]